ncbi:MFS transporter [Pseudohongiella spirulinae]|uniref:Major facilitator family permease n=1 Tax=Pseudohongiella spirulinae TaxID=1249552 RepID=A0A0S2KBZ6_9GAMM|nr:Major facilitator family permease [Pseudohongiella spirulinae]
MMASDQHSSSQIRLVLALGIAQTLGWGSTFYLPAILAQPMARDLGVEESSVFAAFSAALVLTAILGPLIGRLIDVHGGRRMLTLSSILFAAGLVLLSQATDSLTLWFAWMVIGLGMATGLYEAAFASLTVLYGSRARSAITGITLMAGFASTICWPLSAALEVELGWRGVCLFWAAVHLLLGLPLNHFMMPSWRHSETTVLADSEQPPPNHNTLMVLLAFVFAVTWFTSTAMAAHLPRLLQDSGLSLAASVAIAGLIGPAQVLARLLEFSLLRQFHPLLSARLASLSHPAGALLMMVFGAPFAVFFTIMHGLGNGILTIAKGTLPLALFGPHGYGVRQGWLSLPARLLQAAAPFMFALMINRFGLNALWLTLLLGLLASIVLWRIKPQPAA